MHHFLKQKDKVLRSLAAHQPFGYPIRLSREENEFGIDPGLFSQIIDQFHERGFLKINKRSSSKKVIVVVMDIKAKDFLAEGGFSGPPKSKRVDSKDFVNWVILFSGKWDSIVGFFNKCQYYLMEWLSQIIEVLNSLGQ